MAHSTAKPLLSDTAVLILIAILFTALHVATSGPYGFHRDELATLDDARHLQWGFVAYPPLTPAAGRFGLALFGVSTLGIRILPILALAFAVVLSGLMARELGGSRKAQILTTLAVAIVPIVSIQTTVLQYVSFDYLWGVLFTYLLIRLLNSVDLSPMRPDPDVNSEETRWWVTIGATIGLGMMTKYTMGVLVIAMAVHVQSRHKVFENSVNVFAEDESDKTATLQLCRSAGPRDMLVFTGLARAGVEYYLRRFGCGRDLVLLSVPADTADHLGWVRRTGTDDLRTEAKGIAQRFMQETQADGKLWLIPAHGRQDQKVLTDVFDRDLGASTRLPLRGSFFDEVLIYAPKEKEQRPVR